MPSRINIGPEDGPYVAINESSGNLQLEDNSGNVVAEWDETNAQWDFANNTLNNVDALNSNSVETEELGITNAGTIFEQQAHIPCGWATATETPDDVTSTEFVQAGSFIGGFDDTQRPNGAKLYMRYDLRINLDDGETATVRLEGNGDSGASRITEEYQFDGTGSFTDRSSGWIEVTTDAVGDPINVDTIEAKVSGGTLQFSGGMAHGCQFAWRVE